MHISKYFLISTYEENANIIGLVLSQCMHGEDVGERSSCHKIRDFTVRIAGNILQGAIA